MVYKLYNEEGDYQKIDTKERVNLCFCETAITPEGVNVGWMPFDTLEEAMVYFNIEKYEEIQQTI